MGKNITQQARGRGGPRYRVRRRAYRFKITYPGLDVEGIAKVVRLFNSPAHSAPLAKIKINTHEFLVPAAEGLYEGQEIEIGKNPKAIGNIVRLKNIPDGTRIFNIEIYPGSGGKYLRSAGSFALIGAKTDKIIVLIKKRKIELDENCRAIIGTAAGHGRLEKPLVKAGKKFHMMLAKGRMWHRTSPVKVNAVDHPFGSGRGKRIKSKIAKRNAPPGAKVGHIRPRRTGIAK